MRNRENQVTKKTRRRTWVKLGKTTHRGLKRGAYDPGLCAAFQQKFAAGGTVKEVAAEMRIPKTTAYRWAEAVRLAAAEWLRREGWGEARLVREWIAQAKRSRGHVLNAALREIGMILDAYPARKEPAPPVGPVTLIFNTNLELYEGEQANAARLVKPVLVEDPQNGKNPRA